MPHVSRNRLSREVESDLIHALNVVLQKTTREQDIDIFLLSLLTETERVMLAKRLAVILLLKEGYSDSEIAETLHVTRITVSRLRYYSDVKGKGFEIAFKILENEEFVAQMKKSLLKFAGYAARAAGGRVKPEIF